jgi:PAS domain S-box-containing protein
MTDNPTAALLAKIKDLEERLAESEQFVDAIKNGEVDAFAVYRNNQSEIYTLESGDYAYRLLIEEAGEGALNVTEDGLVVYTNKYFQELTGVSYDSIIGTNIFELVAAESKESFSSLFEKAMDGKSKGEIVLFINGKTIPVYISLTSLKPALPTIGLIITDLTEKKQAENLLLLYQQELQERNLELSQTNGELSSFAFIASHDLQEPLRKIKTFSNLILDREGPSLSDSSKDYFQRIINAEKRMRSLIDDLLNYSRINNVKVNFTLINLNEILAEVQDDLNVVITETGTRIHSTELPALKIVQHQVHQLFSNLILNAIKFRRKDVPPVITISAKIISGSDVNAALSAGKNFWWIRIEDNGIGFEPQYGSKIFELFQRVHVKSEYEGTGIGLTICKKIVQNHNGFITAEGKPGIGAVFNIYLPVE